MTNTDSNGDTTPTRLEGKFAGNVVCWFLGLGSLVAWNSMMTISDYYSQLFPDYHFSRVIALVYQPCAIGTMVLYTYYEARINTRIRMLRGFVLYFFSTFALLMVDIGTQGKGGVPNFVGIMFLVGCFGISDAHCQGGIVGDLSFMSSQFMQSFFAGLAASGALTSCLRLLTKAVFDKTDHGLRKGVILFLSISSFFQFLCIFLYALVFCKLPIVKYYRKKAASEGSMTVVADLAAAGITVNFNGTVGEAKFERLSNKQLLHQNLDYAFDLFFIYVITLSIFPGFLYENTGHHQLGTWYSVVLIAMYNVWDLVGRYLPLIDCIRLKSRKCIMVATLARIVFIPSFYFTAKYADQGWMIFLISCLGLTNGYLTVCVVGGAPKNYNAPEQNALGNLLVLFLLGGLFAGGCLDWLWLIGKGSF